MEETLQGTVEEQHDVSFGVPAFSKHDVSRSRCAAAGAHAGSGVLVEPSALACCKSAPSRVSGGADQCSAFSNKIKTGGGKLLGGDE